MLDAIQEGSGFVVGARPRGHQRARRGRGATTDGRASRRRRRLDADGGGLRPAIATSRSSACPASIGRRSRSATSSRWARPARCSAIPAAAPLRSAPFEVGSRSSTPRGTDIYDQARTEREMFVLRADLAPGDSGGRAGRRRRARWSGVAFAIAPDRPGVAYALTLDELRPVLAGPSAPPTVATGACID